MKARFSLVILILGLWQTGFAQWSGNPGAPVRVCSKNSEQTGCWTFTDGTGGSYVFWKDQRNNGSPTDFGLFAQHFDAAGNQLLPDSGKTVVFDPVFKTTDFSIAQDPAGNFWVAWTLTTQTRMDSIVIQKFNKTTLNPIWPGTKTITKLDNALFNVLYTESIRLLPVADSLLVLYHMTWMGGTTLKFLNSVSAQGKARFPYGQQVSGNTTLYGPSTAITNSDGTMLLIQRNGNGAGTGVSAWKYDKKLNLSWGPISITEGTPGLGYDFKVVPDGSGGFIMGYITAGNTDFMATRVDSSGNFVWTPSHKPICNLFSGQNSPDMTINQGSIYATWSDNRPPAANEDIYSQKLNLATGSQLWNPNGRIIFRLNSYIPYPKILAQSNGDVIITSHQSSTGFMAQRVKPDSTLMWPVNGLMVVEGNNNAPNYADYSMQNGNNGNVFIAWSDGNKIFIAGLGDGGLLTDVSPTVSSKKSFQLYPNPNAGSFQLSGLAEGTQELVVRDVMGREIQKGSVLSQNGKGEYRHNLVSGIYWIQIGSKQMRMVVK
jgi:hypothetical protein